MRIDIGRLLHHAADVFGRRRRRRRIGLRFRRRQRRQLFAASRRFVIFWSIWIVPSRNRTSARAVLGDVHFVRDEQRR